MRVVGATDSSLHLEPLHEHDAYPQTAEAQASISRQVGLGGVFWRRAPWRHERRGEVRPFADCCCAQ